jgi:hypothetical protein
MTKQEIVSVPCAVSPKIVQRISGVTITAEKAHFPSMHREGYNIEYLSPQISGKTWITLSPYVEYPLKEIKKLICEAVAYDTKDDQLQDAIYSRFGV